MPELPPPTDDGLYCSEVGAWSKQKHHFLWRYLNAFTTAMRKKWPERHYIDLFAGPGIERIKGTNDLDWGSPLLAAQTHNPFTQLHLCEKIPKTYDALKKRLELLKFPNEPVLTQGDCNDKVHAILAGIGQGALSLAFLDPYGLHLDFRTVEVLAQRKTDLIIFFPDRLDVLRNWDIYDSMPESNLDRFMGLGADWRAIRDNIPREGRAEALRKLYEEQLKKLGYDHFEHERISNDNHPLYLLIFCSKHSAGSKIWRRTSLIKPDGQRSLDFGD